MSTVHWRQRHTFHEGQYSLLHSLRPAIGLYLNRTNRYLKCIREKSSSSTYHRPRPLQKPRRQRPTSCHINRVWWLEQLWSQVWWRYSWNTSSWSLRRKDQDFKDRLCYMVIFLTDWATEWDHVSKSQNEIFKKKITIIMMVIDKQINKKPIK